MARKRTSGLGLFRVGRFGVMGVTARASVLAAAFGVAAAGASAQQSTPAVKIEPGPPQPSPRLVPEGERPFALMVGDKAPVLQVGEWVKGSPLEKGLEPGKVYLVEFWATWCGPCIRAMPHLVSLQEKYKDRGLTVVAVTAEDRNNPLTKVREFVENNPDTTRFTVAWDSGRETYMAYMRAAGRNGIPASFLVDRTGRIAYIGHPMQIDDTLARVMDGSFDVDAAAADYERQQRLAPQISLQQREIQAGRREKDWDRVVDAADRLIALDDTLRYYAAFKFHVLLNEKQSRKEAYLWANEAVTKLLWDDGMTLAQLCSAIVDDADAGDEELALAERAVSRSMELMGEAPADQRAFVQVIGSRVAEDRGDVLTAIARQERAVDLAGDPRQTEAYQARLDELRSRGQGG